MRLSAITNPLGTAALSESALTGFENLGVGKLPDQLGKVLIERYRMNSEPSFILK